MKIKNPRCKECFSTQTYIKLRDKKRICRACGYIEDLKEVKDDRTN